ncbi:hypothetical protein BD413DRAFT_95935 [Trametes elegans]|nr:hypothetical protein BD413DRAFT_95935 [Trametes elegans]
MRRASSTSTHHSTVEAAMGTIARPSPLARKRASSSDSQTSHTICAPWNSQSTTMQAAAHRATRVPGAEPGKANSQSVLPDLPTRHQLPSPMSSAPYAECPGEPVVEPPRRSRYSRSCLERT